MHSTSVAELKVLVRIAAAACFVWASGGALSGTAGDSPEVLERWLTRAEQSGFAATSSYRETMALLEAIDAASPRIRLESFGVSASGRPLPLVIVAPEESLMTPQAAARSGLPVVLIQSCIHPGEVDGKVASLMILRDIARGWEPELGKAAVLLFVPIYNADGHERISPYNRPNQNGPSEGMGFRTTSNGLDLNRDHLKLDSVEARSLVSLVNLWRPHLHVDIHVTNGSDHAWALTWSIAEPPQLAPTIGAWLDQHLPRALAATESAGYRNGPYVDLLDRSDPSKGFSSVVSEPRFSTGYFALRNRPSILIETHAYKPFEERVRATHAFLVALIRETAEAGKELVESVREAERRTVGLARDKGPDSKVVLTWEPQPPSDPIPFPVREWYLAASLVTGRQMLLFRPDTVHEIEAPWVHTVRPALQVTRPRGYLVEPGWPRIEQLLALHGLELARLERDCTVDCESLRVSHPTFASESYQGHVRVDFDTERHREPRSFPAGSLWVDAAQPDFEIAVQLLEPEAPDSMLRWGLLSTVFERKEYIGQDVLEKQVRKLLEDPEVAAEWQRALEDQELANDPRQRHLWWYRRTPYWDRDIGQAPYARALEELPCPAHVNAR